jgi:hypothetical protein
MSAVIPAIIIFPIAAFGWVAIILAAREAWVDRKAGKLAKPPLVKVPAVGRREKRRVARGPEVYRSRNKASTRTSPTAAARLPPPKQLAHMDTSFARPQMLPHPVPTTSLRSAASPTLHRRNDLNPTVRHCDYS